jgi:5-formyltetrahydrofolate cyclo-ligase
MNKINPSIDHCKQQARSYLLQKRINLSLERKKEAVKMAEKCLISLANTASLVLSYASFNDELNVWPLNHALAEQDKLVLPKIDQQYLRLFKVSRLDHLIPHSWGILEPDSQLCKEIEWKDISLALIPGLGFDMQTKHRLGYGKGYYDRLLKRFPSQIAVYGVGFKEQEISDLPFSQHDVALLNHYLF